MTKLTPLQAAFVRAYCANPLDGSAAYVAAGGSKRRAKQGASEMLKVPAVAEAIEKFRGKVEEKAQITAARVLEEYAKLAFLDPRQFFDDSGNLIDVHKLPAEVAAALAGMDVVTERVGYDGEGKPMFSAVRRIKFADKKAALDSVARCLGMFKDKLEVSVDETLAEKLARAKDRTGT